MRRRIPWIVAVAVVLGLAAILTGCGSKDATSIVKDLDKVMSKMESYQGSGTMTLHTGQQPLNYKVEVWYQKPNYYRIALTNEKRDITQIVLRNDDGVFVLTPSLNKSYRFQSDWPENQGQVYLYQTLVKSIQMDNSRQFTTDKDAYVFDVMASNYQNGSFARQKIWLAKDDYAPRHVEVTDPNNNVMVEVQFDAFEFGKKFESTAFDMKSNMNGPSGAGDDKQTTGTDGSGQASGQTDEQTSGMPQDEGASAPPADDPNAGDDFAMAEPDPDALPEGVVQKDMKDVQLGDTMGVMLRYTGAYDFTILERAAKNEMEAMSQGIMLDLGFTWGQLSGGETKTLTWSYGGVEYRLTTADLPQEDMVRLAQSMVESSGK
ncbi:LolA family protein [Cohnella caldifontis]|uniref:LolA family protein n=1 Tax=Cohnella caldifontis TaxID=3027471 RepID=UPI0023EC4773|nr:outer membrane lipoprotein carrier protein LolA [Cohnella sp. YIM B05605]